MLREWILIRRSEWRSAQIVFSVQGWTCLAYIDVVRAKTELLSSNSTFQTRWCVAEFDTIACIGKSWIQSHLCSVFCAVAERFRLHRLDPSRSWSQCKSCETFLNDYDPYDIDIILSHMSHSWGHGFSCRSALSAVTHDPMLTQMTYWFVQYRFDMVWPSAFRRSQSHGIWVRWNHGIALQVTPVTNVTNVYKCHSRERWQVMTSPNPSTMPLCQRLRLCLRLIRCDVSI